MSKRKKPGQPSPWSETQDAAEPTDKVKPANDNVPQDGGPETTPVTGAVNDGFPPAMEFIEVGNSENGVSDLLSMLLGRQTGGKVTGCPVQAILREVHAEVHRAESKHEPMHSPHEGISVIREELDELWDEVKADRGLQESARKEAIQVAAMAVRYIMDLTDA